MAQRILVHGETGESMDKIKVLLIDMYSEERKEIVRMLKNVEYIVVSGEIDSYKDIARLDQIETNVVLLGSSKQEKEGYILAREILAKNPDISIIMIEDVLNEEIMQRVIATGMQSILIRPLTPERVINAIYSANQQLIEKESAQKTEKKEVKKSYGRGQVYPVVGSKGGVGRTFIAVNLAIAIRKMTGKRVVLLDLDLDFGNSALALNLLPRFTITDIVDDIHNMDSDMIESYLITHESEIRVLPSSIQPIQTEFMGQEEIEKIIYLLQDAFDYIVVDMPARFSEKITTAYTVAEKLVMVTEPEVASLRNTKIALATLDELNFLNAKIKLVLNKYDKNGKIRKKDVEATLDKELTASIVLDHKKVSSSLNLGEPIVMLKGNKVLKSDFSYLVRKLLDNVELKTLH